MKESVGDKKLQIIGDHMVGCRPEMTFQIKLQINADIMLYDRSLMVWQIKWQIGCRSMMGDCRSMIICHGRWQIRGDPKVDGRSVVILN